jgi:hypothetical protein
MTTAIAPELPAAVAEKPAERTLTGHDRCDSCGSQAYVKTMMMAGELLFCGHHFTRFEAKIRSGAITVVDERQFLTGERRTAGDGFA